MIDEEPLFNVHITTWHTSAISLFYHFRNYCRNQFCVLNKMCVIFQEQFRKNYKSLLSHHYRLNLIEFFSIFLPELYGEGYHAIKVKFLQIQMKLKYHLDYLLHLLESLF
jgi:CIC family chloride channel protein